MEDIRSDKLYLHFKERFGKKHPEWPEHEVEYFAEVAVSYLYDLMDGKIDAKNPPTVEEYLRTYEERKKGNIQ